MTPAAPHYGPVRADALAELHDLLTLLPPSCSDRAARALDRLLGPPAEPPASGPGPVEAMREGLALVRTVAEENLAAFARRLASARERGPLDDIDEAAFTWALGYETGRRDLAEHLLAGLS
jgi:hypothetical protein